MCCVRLSPVFSPIILTILVVVSQKNSDFWILSSPKVWMRRKDQLANGFMQYNAMDTSAAVLPVQAEGNLPFDFSVDPDAEEATSESLPPVANFFSYFTMGNMGFIAYSGEVGR